MALYDSYLRADETARPQKEFAMPVCVEQALRTKSQLTRAPAADYLTSAGFKISKSRLSKLAMDGTGPSYTLWGSRTFYNTDTLLSWAIARQRPPAKRAGGPAISLLKPIESNSIGLEWNRTEQSK
jgi:hypothetical protein